jgi:hypothetical protein
MELEGRTKPIEWVISVTVHAAQQSCFEGGLTLRGRVMPTHSGHVSYAAFPRINALQWR